MMYWRNSSQSFTSSAWLNRFKSAGMFILLSSSPASISIMSGLENRYKVSNNYLMDDRKLLISRFATLSSATTRDNANCFDQTARYSHSKDYFCAQRCSLKDMKYGCLSLKDRSICCSFSLNATN